MERVPDEIIGEILSRIKDTREVVRASTTCKKWRRAMKYYLKSLTFYISRFRNPVRCLEIHRLESILDQTIMQTKRLESLSIVNDAERDFEFSADRVLAWLMNAKDTLRELRLYVEIRPRINVFKKCQWNQLEVLELGHFSFAGVELGDMTLFPCLKKLLLKDVRLTALQLNSFIDLCPKIESLRLLGIDVGPRAVLEWFIDTLKSLDVVSMYLERFVLVADHLESLRFRQCGFQLFKLVGNEALKVLNIGYTGISYFDVGENIKTLENVELTSSIAVQGPMLYRMISKSSNLKRLRLWHVDNNICYGFTSLEKISASFPRLVHLSVYYNKAAPLNSSGSFLLQDVALLELGFLSYLNFSNSVRAVLDKCPNLKKVAVHMIHHPEDDRFADLSESFSEFLSSLVQLGREYLHVEFEFKYESC